MSNPPVHSTRKIPPSLLYGVAGCADDDELLTLAEALGVNGRGAADHADGGELGNFVGEGHEDRDWAEGLVGEGSVEAGENDTLAEVNELHGEMGDAGVEELYLVDADDVYLVDLCLCAGVVGE